MARTGPDTKIQQKGYLTVTSPANEVVMTVSSFDSATAANQYYGYTKGSSSSPHDRVKGTLVLSGNEEGSWAQKFDSCIS